MEQLKTSDKLLRCPLCGGKQLEIGRITTTFGSDIYIKCGFCALKMQLCAEYELEELYRRWNTRKPMERIVAKLEEHSERWTDSTFDEDGFVDDDSFEVVRLDKAIEIVKEEM